MNLYYPSDMSSTSKSVWVLDAFSESCDTAIKYHSAEFENKNSGVFWGLGSYNYALIKKYKEHNINWIFTDMPYWNRWMGKNRDTCYWRIIPNDLHITSVGDFPSDRLKKSPLSIKEWKAKGDYILVCPSSYMLENYYNEINWTENTIKEIKKYTDRPIKVRNKPRNATTSGPQAATIAFEDDCANAYAVVTLASIAGIEAALLGTPVFCHASSACAPIAATDISLIETPLRPDRSKWLNTLSYFQYTEAEIKQGLYKQIFQ
jgi:hypothetical protein